MRPNWSRINTTNILTKITQAALIQNTPQWQLKPSHTKLQTHNLMHNSVVGIHSPDPSLGFDSAN